MANHTAVNEPQELAIKQAEQELANAEEHVRWLLATLPSHPVIGERGVWERIVEADKQTDDIRSRLKFLREAALP